MNEMTNVDGGSSAVSEHAAFKTWQCVLCGFIYKEAEGMPQDGIVAGTRWGDVPEDWICPDCSATKVDFEMIEV